MGLDSVVRHHQLPQFLDLCFLCELAPLEDICCDELLHTGDLNAAVDIDS
jgi:hypothetical protein